MTIIVLYINARTIQQVAKRKKDQKKKKKSSFHNFPTYIFILLKLLNFSNKRGPGGIGINVYMQNPGLPETRHQMMKARMDGKKKKKKETKEDKEEKEKGVCQYIHSKVHDKRKKKSKSTDVCDSLLQR